jgi:hypothetical protein
MLYAIYYAIAGIMLHSVSLFIMAAVCLFIAIAFPEYPTREPLQPMTPEEAQAMRASMARFAEKQKSGAATGCTVIDALCIGIGLAIFFAVGKWLVAIGVLLP